MKSRPIDIIPLADCVKRGVYRIRARNFSVAMFDGERDFIGVRHKFDSSYLFGEIHWDADESFGTAVPFALIEMLPADIDDNPSQMNQALFNYLSALAKREREAGR